MENVKRKLVFVPNNTNPFVGRWKTYSNSCFAACEDIEILSEGACNTNSTGCQVEDKFYELGKLQHRMQQLFL